MPEKEKSGEVSFEGLVGFAEILIVGNVLSRMKSRFTDAIFDAASVCVNTTFFVPSPAVKVTVTLKLVKLHVVVAGPVTSPVIVMVRPFSQAPAIKRVDLAVVLVAGPLITKNGAAVSIVHV